MRLTTTTKISFAVCLLAACQPDEQNIGLTVTGPTDLPTLSLPTPHFGTSRWAIAIDSGVENGSVGGNVAVDSIGDVVVGGTITLQVDGPIWYQSSAFLSKRVASDGAERWRIPITGTEVRLQGVAIGPDDSIVVTGAYRGTVDFGGATLPGPADHDDTFIAKYTWDGHLVWAHGLNPTANTGGEQIAVDSSGRIVMIGRFSHTTFVLDGTTYINGEGDVMGQYIASFDQDGALLWGRGIQGGPWVTGLAVTPNDDVVVVGSFAGSASFGGAVHDADAVNRAFIARYRSDGLYLSSATLGDPNPMESWASGVAIAANGDVVVQTSQWNTSSSANHNFGAVYALASDNTEIWHAEQTAVGGTQPLYRSLATTPDGQVVSTTWRDFWTQGALELSSYDLTGTGATSSVAHRASDGVIGLDWSGSTTATATGAMVFSGSMTGTVDFGFGPIGQPLPAQPDPTGPFRRDLFVAVVDPL